MVGQPLLRPSPLSADLWLTPERLRAGSAGQAENATTGCCWPAMSEGKDPGLDRGRRRGRTRFLGVEIDFRYPNFFINLSNSLFSLLRSCSLNSSTLILSGASLTSPFFQSVPLFWNKLLKIFLASPLCSALT